MDPVMQEYRPAGPSSLSARLIRFLCRVIVRPVLAWWPLGGPLARLASVPELVLRLLPRLPSTEFTTVEGSTWRGEYVRARGSTSGRSALLYFHGGAFVFCGLATHRRIVERLALRTGVPVLSVDYRQFPKGKLDDSLADAMDAFSWLLAQGIDSKSIVCIGDSAGGYLAFALTLKVRDLGLMPAGVVGLSPWLDFEPSGKEGHPNVNCDALVPTKRLQLISQLCTGSNLIEPLRSPVNCALRGFPPVLILCAEDEVMRHDAELMALRLAAAGVQHKLQIWRGQVHAFPVLGNALPESRAAIEEVAAFVTDVLSIREAVTSAARFASSA